jgi:hypothetical protein
MLHNISICNNTGHENNRIYILFYDNSDTAVCASTIEILDGWTPKLFLVLLLQEWCLTDVTSLFRVEDQACDDIFKMQLLYYNCSATQLVKLVISSPNYSSGGFILASIIPLLESFQFDY